MAQTLTGIVTWLKNWFYDKGEVNTYLNAKANKNLTNANMNVVTDSGGNITTEEKPTIPDVSGFIDTAGTGLSKSGTTLNHSNTISAQSTAVFKKFKYDAQGHITGTANVGVNDLPSHTHSASEVTDSSASSYANISSSLTSSSTQSDINGAINTKLGTLIDVDFIVVVTSLPTASSSTMGKIYLVAISGSSDNNFKEYVTVKQGSSYSWEKLGEVSGSGLSVDWSDITSKPSVFPPQGHNHDDTEVIITDSTIQEDWGAYTQYEFNSMAKTVTEDLDSAKADVVHTHTKSDITDFSHSHGQITNDGKVTSTAVTVASADNIIITDASDSSKIKRVANILSDHIKDGNAYNNIGSSANATQSTINTAIDTALGNKANSSDIPVRTSDLTNDGEDGTNVYVANNDSRLSDARTPTSHTHGQISNDGKITYTPVTVASDDYIVITDTNDSSKVKRVANLLTDHIKDGTAHSNIGSSANDNQSTINTKINSVLGGKASAGHHHGQINNDGAITSTAVTVDSNDNIVITDYSDESKVKRVANLLAGHIIDSSAHTNIGSSANDTQATINSDIDTALSNKENKGTCITSIALVPKATDNTGAITLYYGDEPS